MAGTPIGAGQVTSTAAGSGEDQIHRSTLHDRARIDDVDTGRGPRSGARRDEPRAAYLGVHGAGQVPGFAKDDGPGVGGRLHRPLDLAHQPPPAIDRACNDAQLRRVAPPVSFAGSHGRAPPASYPSGAAGARPCGADPHQARDSRLGLGVVCEHGMA